MNAMMARELSLKMERRAHDLYQLAGAAETRVGTIQIASKANEAINLADQARATCERLAAIEAPLN